MNRQRFNKIRTICATGLVLIILGALPLSYTGEVKKAEAQFPFSFSGGINVTDIGLTITNTLQQLSTAALEQKELILDGLFFDIAQKALQQMTNDILKWVNSGLDGDPAFVTDLSDYLLDISDDVAADFIYGDELSTLCTPFQLSTRLALVNSYQKTSGHTDFKDQAACTLDEYSSNSQAFLSGDFNAGGWSAWFEVVLNPQNTPLGARLAGDRQLAQIVQDERAEAIEDYRAGQGFISKQACTGSGADKKCVITTPGSIIKDQLSFSLQIPALKLIEADEMNEVIGALFGNLANQALTGINGLLGLGGNASFSDNSFGASGNLSYLDAVGQESAQSGTNQAGGNKIQQAFNTETKVLELELAIVQVIDEATTAFETAHAPHKNDSCWNLQIPTKLSTTLQELLVKVPVTVDTVIKLQDLVERFDETSSASAQLKILQEFTALQSSGNISGQASVVKFDFLLNSELKTLIQTFKKDIAAEEKSC